MTDDKLKILVELKRRREENKHIIDQMKEVLDSGNHTFAITAKVNNETNYFFRITQSCGELILRDLIEKLTQYQADLDEEFMSL